MRWFFTNAHPLAEAVQLAGEDVISTPAHHQIAHYDWLEEAVAAAAVPDVPWWTPRNHRTDPFSDALVRIPHDPVERSPDDYPIGRYLRALDPDVLVIAPLLQPGLGISKGAVMRWANLGGGRLIVGMAHDPGTLDAARANRWRGCSVNVHNCKIYVTDDEDTARVSARERRTVWWQPGLGAEALVELARSARAGRAYMAGSRAKPVLSS